MRNFTNQEKFVSYLISPRGLYLTGLRVEKSSLLGLLEDIEDIFFKKNKNVSQIKETFATQESLLQVRKKIWIDKLSCLEANFQTLKLSLILDQESTSKGKDLKPFWNAQKKEISERLWLPTKTDSADLGLNLSKKSSKGGAKANSWFLINQKLFQNKNSLKTSFQSSLFSLPDSTVSEVTLTKKKSKKQPKELKQNYKTMRFRLLPSKREVEELDSVCEQFRWYYNSLVDLVPKHFYRELSTSKKFSKITIRKFLREFEYVENIRDGIVERQFARRPGRNEYPSPNFENKVYERTVRGAIDKFVSNINSAVANKKNGNISKFKMHFMSRKDATEICRYDDHSYPKFIREIDSRYWFRDSKTHKRVKVRFKDVETASGIEIYHDKIKETYTLHCPVDLLFSPENDLRKENQFKFSFNKGRIISLDPGVRKFLVGYDPDGRVIEFAPGDHKVLYSLMREADLCTCRKSKHLKWLRVKNMVKDLHNQIISFLVQNYDEIIVPEFLTQQMVKGKKLHRSTKRMLMIYSFHSFKEKLLFKCNQYDKKLMIVTEEYTSKTCTCCGELNNVGSSEVYKCNKCGVKLDRDLNGARNILLKNITLR